MKLLIADDHNMVLSGLKSLLENDLWAVSTANNYDTLKSLLVHDEYDILLLDIKFGKIDSRMVMQDIKKLGKKMKIIALTSLDDAESIKTTMAAGVDAYLIKSDEVSEIKLAIDQVLKGGKYISNSVKSRFLESELIGSSKEKPHLTPREKDILKLIMEEQTTKQIADKLFLSEKTVENYRANMMAKLDVKNIAGLVKKTLMDGLLN